jgi:hypothetical protein
LIAGPLWHVLGSHSLPIRRKNPHEVAEYCFVLAILECPDTVTLLK